MHMFLEICTFLGVSLQIFEQRQRCVCQQPLIKKVIDV
jgi:hypothetical protein